MNHHDTGSCRSVTVSTRPVLDLRLLVPCLSAWALGAWALSWSGQLRTWVAVAAGLLLVAVLVLGRRYRGRHGRAGLLRDGPGVLALALVATALVLGASAAHEATRRVGPVDDLARQGAMVRAEGVVLTEPIVRAGRARSDSGSEAPQQVLLRVRIESVTARGETTAVRAPVFVRGKPSWADVGWHDRIRLTGKLAPAEAADPEVAVLSPRGPPERVGERSLVRSAAEHLRSGMRDAVEPLPADARGLLPAPEKILDVVYFSETSPDDILTDVGRVLNLLSENRGRMKQVDIVEETGWSKSKVSRLLSRMEERGDINRLRVGRGNIVYLEGAKPSGARSPREEDSYS